MKFREAVVSFWANYAATGPRAGRPEFWWNQALVVLAAGVAAALDEAVDFPVFMPLLVLVATVPCQTLTVRRLHDAGYSGWFILVPFAALAIAFVEGEPGWNRYGPRPGYDPRDSASLPFTPPEYPRYRPWALTFLVAATILAALGNFEVMRLAKELRPDADAVRFRALGQDAASTPPDARRAFRDA